MNFKAAITPDDCQQMLQEETSALGGGDPVPTIAEALDDGSFTFPDIRPEPSSAETMADQITRTLSAALYRDARNITATRLQLARLGANNVLRSFYEMERILTLGGVGA